MAHTTGEWAFRKNGHDNFTITTDFGDIADVYAPENATEDEEFHNVQLMVSAPKMLQAIKTMLSVLAEQLDDEYKANESILEAFDECAVLANKLTPYTYELGIDPDYVSQRESDEM